jgi:hypothetical protein
MKKFFLIWLCLFSFVAAAAPERVPFGEVKAIQGEAKVGGAKLSVGSKVFAGDQVTTAKKSFLRIKLADGSGVFQVGPATSIKLSVDEKAASTIDLVKGYLLSTLKPAAKPSENARYQVRTKTAAMGVRGTTFFARVEKGNKTFQCICEGRVESTWKNGKEVWESKHHEKRHIFSAEKAEPAPLSMPTDHTDEEIAELNKLLD